MVLKFKVDGMTYSTELLGTPPNKDVFFLHYEHKSKPTDDDEAHAEFRKALWMGKEMKCIIEISSSTYSFSIDGSEFKETLSSLEEERKNYLMGNDASH